MPIVTISRGSLSGGEALAERLGAILGFPVISRETVLETAAASYGVSEGELARNMELPPSLWQRLTKQRARFVLAVQAALADMIEGGDAVYHGLAGQFLLKNLTHVIKVRLIAPLEYRIQSAVIDRSMTRAEAEKFIERADQQRETWVKAVYGAQWSDPSLYDVVLNLQDVGLEPAADLVARLAQSSRYKPTEDSRRVLANFVLRNRVRAALTFHTSFQVEEIGLQIDGGVIRIGHPPPADEARKHLVDFLEHLPGVARVDLEQAARSPTEGTRPARAQKVRDLMLPVSRYPHVHSWTTIREAMGAIGSSTIKLEDGHLIAPRYVLVLDERDALVGILSRRDLLRGLKPHLQAIRKSWGQLDGVPPLAEDRFPFPSSWWVSLFSPSAARNAREPVRAVMSPIRGTVDVDDDVDVAVATMLGQDIDLIPVLERGRVVGVVIMTDVFDEVAEYILESRDDAR